jgi:hypothetical protein
MEYVTHCTLTVNGKEISDFRSVTEGSVQYNKQVPLMSKTGHAQLTPRYKVSVEYVIPKTGSFDWKTVRNGTLSIGYDSGARRTYSGVYILEEGDEKKDGENEATREIQLGAENRIDE